MKLFDFFKKNQSSGRKNQRPLSPATAVKVAEVSQEYKFVQEAVCDCSKAGTFKVKKQSISFYNGVPMDILEVQCAHCSATYNFYFDFSEAEHYKKLLKNVPNIGNIVDKSNWDAKTHENISKDDF